MNKKLPQWVEIYVITPLNLLVVLLITCAVLYSIGKDPFVALSIMIQGAFGSTLGWGYTLFYATNFIFTGLAVAIAAHARLFNIGGEGQATLGGLGVSLLCLSYDWPHWLFALPFAMLAGMAFGGFWAFIPGYLQVKRGSHIVITTIMFNFVPSALMVYLLSGILKQSGQMEPATQPFPKGTHLPTLHDFFAFFSLPFAKHTPANISFIIAIICLIAFGFVLNRTRFGYELRAFGFNETAAQYAGISGFRIIVIAMIFSGSMAGLMAINNVMGSEGRLILNITEGAGFIGIAVALMGRNHPLGIFFAAILFGFLYQGGAELALWEAIPRELVFLLQGVVILFAGALNLMFHYPVAWLYHRIYSENETQ